MEKGVEPMALNYSLYQLVTVIIMKHLNELTDVYQEEFVVYRMENLDRQHENVREYRELSGEYAELIDQIKARGEKKLSDESFDKLKRLVTLRVSETERFHYLAGLNDARRVFEI
jgi:predicted transcriptional regulator